MPNNTGISSGVRKYLSDRPGVDIYVSDMENALKLTKKQIQAAVYNRSQAGDPIQTVMSGRCWRWAPNGKAPEPEAVKPTTAPKDTNLTLMNLVGVLATGETLFQDTETGCLWKAGKL